VCPNGERLSDAQNRMIEAVQLIGGRHVGERVAAVTHAVMIRLVVARLRDLHDSSWRIPVGRGSLTRFEVEDGEIRLAELPAGDDVD
jgi:broad specificity phosphatase PhoE